MPSSPDDTSTKSSRVEEKKTSTRKLNKSKGSNSESIRTSDGSEIVLRKHDLSASNFSKKSISSHSKGSGIFIRETGKKGGASGEIVADDLSSLDLSGSQKSKASTFSQYFKNVSQSPASAGTRSLRKTKGITDGGSETFEPDACNIQCGAEILKLEVRGKSNEKVPSRSDVFLSDSILKETDSRGDDCIRNERKTLSHVPFQRNENTAKGSNKLGKGSNKRGKKVRNFWSKNFISNKSQIMSFFAREEKHETNPEKCKQLSEQYEPESEKYEEEKKGKKEMVIRYLDPPVPVEEDLAIKETMRSLFFFYLQLACITLIAMNMVSSEMYYFTALNAREFFDTPFFMNINSSIIGEKATEHSYRKSLRKSTTVEDFWAFSETTLVTLLYWDFYSSNMDPITHKSKNNEKMFNVNQIVGVARIRQVRVGNGSCQIHQNVRRFFDTCYSGYSVFSEDTKPIKKGMGDKATATAWVYTDAKHLDSSYHWGQIALYGGGGYYLDLADNKEDAQKMIEELKENNWISSATRAVFITFTLYNANINLFCICKIILEFPPVGGVIPLQDFRSLKLIRYANTLDFLVLAFEFIYLVFVVQNTMDELKTMYKERTSYIFFWGNALNFIKLILSYLCIILGVFRKVSSAHLISSLDKNYNKYTEFQEIKLLQMAFDYSIAILLFFTWIKLFTLLNFTKTMLQFKKTLAKSIEGVLQFLPLFLTIFTAFAFLGYLLFGNQVYSYRTFWLSFLTLLQAFLGEFNLAPIMESNRLLGPIFYIAFIFFIFFVLLNVFIAITNDAYMAIKAQIIPDSPRIMEYIKRGWVNTFTCGRPLKRRKSRKITKKKILFEDIKKALRRAGFKEDEISIFFHKYKVNCRNFLEEKTKTRIMEGLELKGINFEETSDQFQIDALRRKLDEFKERMEKWEVRLQPVIDKVDILLHRL